MAYFLFIKKSPSFLGSGGCYRKGSGERTGWRSSSRPPWAAGSGRRRSPARAGPRCWRWPA
ncbi:hypothetical protein C4566_01555 [Candidatus Parcubacteria bacterium]|nr:MAG: hypothetical protein C4566_01555 [Candidatus Parcubacteria bacterium]